MDLLRWQFIKNTIWARKHIIKSFAPIFLKINIWVTNYNLRISSNLRLFGFEISKSSANWKSTWEHSKWSNQWIFHCVFFNWWLFYSYLLQAWLSICIYHRMRLINVTSCCFYPSEFWYLTRLVVLTQVNCNSSKVFGSNRSAITNIYYVYIIIESHYNICAAAWLTVLHFLCLLIFCKNFINIISISLKTSFDNCLLYVLWKIWLQDYVIMKMLFQIFSALISSMAVIYCKNLNFWPLVFWHFRSFCWRLDNIQYNSYSVFITFPD